MAIAATALADAVKKARSWKYIGPANPLLDEILNRLALTEGVNVISVLVPPAPNRLRILLVVIIIGEVTK